MKPDAEFFRAFVAVRYLLGARGEVLLEGLPESATQGRSLVRHLSSENRAERAAILATELERVARAFERAKLLP